MHSLHVGKVLRFGWDTFKERPWFFIGMVVAVVLLSGIVSSLAPDPVTNAFDFLLAIAVVILNILIEMGLVAFALKANDAVKEAQFKDLWHPQPFWKYVGVKILAGVIAAGPILVALGLIALGGVWVTIGIVFLIPAIVWAVLAALALIFATYLVIDRDRGPIEAAQESAHITKGHRGQLFLLALSLIGINILGALALLVGLVVTVPVSLIAIAHAYRTLAGKGAAA